MVMRATEFMAQHAFSEVITYLDNDEAGTQATLKLAEWCESQEGVFLGCMRHLYEDYKDANEKHVEGVLGDKEPNPISAERIYPKGI